MPQPGAHDIDPLEGSEPPPLTFTARRLIAAVGALAIVAAVGVLLYALGGGATPTSVRDELNGTLPAKSHPAARPAE